MTTSIGNNEGNLPVNPALSVHTPIQVQPGHVSSYDGVDQIEPSLGLAPATQTPPPESPEAPVPNAIGLGNIAAKETQVNLWLKYPNRMGALMVAMLELITIQSNSRFNEAQMQKNLNAGMFELGMANADLAKSLRDMQADQELMKAVGSFMTAGLAFYQANAMASERGKTQRETDAKYKDEIDAQRSRINQFQEAHAEGHDDNKVFNESALTQEQKAEYATEKQKLKKIENESFQEFNEKAQFNRSIQEQKFRGVNSLSEGAIGLYSSGITKEMGAAEKQKAINETLIQCFSKLSETLSKSRDEEASELQAFFQMLQQYSSETKSTISTRG